MIRYDRFALENW